MFERLIARFMSFTNKIENGCWEWQGYVGPTGYGTFTVFGKNFAAHRISYELFCREVPVGSVVQHKCDNRKCVNPKHLSHGNQKNNIEDAILKKRMSSQKKTHCPRGHEYTTENTYISKHNGIPIGRVCKKCRVIHTTNSKMKIYRAKLSHLSP
jgi:HNH endonuclease